MNRDIEHALAVTAMRLRSADPEGWSKFLEILKLRYSTAADKMVSAVASDLQQMQGRALEARALLQSLENAPSLHAEMKEKSNVSRNGFTRTGVRQFVG